MYRFLLKPKWLLFHLLVVVLVVVMVNLGIWQLHRLQDRRAFNAEVRERSSMPIAPFESVVTDEVRTVDDADLVEWRPVTLDGTYVAAEQVEIINRSQDGMAGVDVVTPMQLHDGTLVLVNRGFVPDTAEAPLPPEGEVSITGVVRATERRGFGGLTDPAEGDLTELQRLDIERIAEQLPGPVAPVSVDLVTSDPTSADAPIPVPEPELSEGPHLSYMVQWWIFSACAIAGWVLAVRRSAHKRPEQPASDSSPVER
ncbi:MAG: SURF1 family protein [Actinobacteria bacterium]|nr:SURF1 family protein [Actinomycetota bacterium]